MSDFNEYTYIGIGSCPHALCISDLSEETDQMIPFFLLSHIQNNAFINIILIDPLFKHIGRLNFLVMYFKNLETKYNLSFDFSKGEDFNPITGNLCETYFFLSQNVKVKVYGDWFENTNLFFFNTFIEKTLQNKESKLVVQDFTGDDSRFLSKSLHKMSSLKRDFCDRVLVDMTYGESSCTTNMKTTFPLEFSNGNFFNLLLYSNEEIKSIDFTLLPENAKLFPVKRSQQDRPSF
jgi:hypothetical protein